MKKLSLFRNIPLYLVSALVLLSACSNSTSSDEEEHADPKGFVLSMNGADIVTQLSGGTISGEIELKLGDETDLITIYFFDENGDHSVLKGICLRSDRRVPYFSSVF